MKDFTVIGFYEETSQIFCHHVSAPSAQKAFFQVATDFPDATLTAALDGHLTEGNGIEFPGESLVEAETIIDQPEVFNV